MFLPTALERFHRTLLDEHLHIAGRTMWYEEVDAMQADLDTWLRHYNRERPHQGRLMEGPYAMFVTGLENHRPPEALEQAP